MKPLMLKLPPYLLGPSGGSIGVSRELVLNLVNVCIRSGVDAITISNTKPTLDARISTGVGGLSGRAVFSDTSNMVRDIRNEVGQRLTINACGGISTGEGAWEVLKSGADTLQLYTSLIYRGPSVVQKINKDLVGILDRERVESLESFFLAGR